MIKKTSVPDLQVSELTKTLLSMLKRLKDVCNEFTDVSMNSEEWNNGELEVESLENEFYANFYEMEKSFQKIVMCSIEFNMFHTDRENTI